MPLPTNCSLTSTARLPMHCCSSEEASKPREGEGISKLLGGDHDGPPDQYLAAGGQRNLGDTGWR